MLNYRFNFENCCEWKIIHGSSTIIKTVTGDFPLSWQDGIGGALVDYAISGAEGGVGDYGGKKNQLVQNGNFESTQYWNVEQNAEISAENNTLIFTSTGNSANISNYFTADVPSGHKIFVSMYTDTRESITTGKPYFALYSSSWQISGNSYYARIPNSEETIERIVTLTNNYRRLNFGLSGGAGGSVKAKSAISVDLTAMFGAGNEPSDVATAKAMIAEVMGGQQDYYTYDAGTDYYKIPVSVTGNDYSQSHTIYRTSQLTDGQTIRMTTDGLPNFTDLPTGSLQMGVETTVTPSGEVKYRAKKT